MTDIERIRKKIKEFNSDRDWDQYHNPKDLLIALMSEVGELADYYRWLSHEELKKVHSNPEQKKKIEEEIADILIYLITLAEKTDIDIIKATEAKLEKNKTKYPVKKIKGIHSNSLEGIKGKE